MINIFEFHNKKFLRLLLLLLLLLPLIAYICEHCKKQSTLSFPYIEILIKAFGSRRKRSQHILTFLRFLVLIALIFALARPQLIHRFAKSNSSGVDIMLAVDIFSSMMGFDFQEEREQKITTHLDIAKQVINEFIKNLPTIALECMLSPGMPISSVPSPSITIG
jgi:Ca-activated chloride channel family protein